MLRMIKEIGGKKADDTQKPPSNGRLREAGRKKRWKTRAAKIGDSGKPPCGKPAYYTKFNLQGEQTSCQYAQKSSEAVENWNCYLCHWSRHIDHIQHLDHIHSHGFQVIFHSIISGHCRYLSTPGVATCWFVGSTNALEVCGGIRDAVHSGLYRTIFRRSQCHSQ